MMLVSANLVNLKNSQFTRKSKVGVLSPADRAVSGGVVLLAAFMVARTFGSARI
jgi:hypothetical protein